MKHFNCMWSHCCGETKLCCHFCKRKSCEWRCNDKCESCKYKETDDLKEKSFAPVEVKVEEKKLKVHNEMVDSKIATKLRNYKKQNRLKLDQLEERIGVSRALLSRVISSRTVVKIRSDSYNKIKEFVKTIVNIESRNLW